MGNHLLLNCIYNHRTCFISICLIILNALLLLFFTSTFHSNTPLCDPNNLNPSSSRSPTNQTLNASELYTKNGELYPWKNIRLPEHIRPIHYDLFMVKNFFIYLEFSFFFFFFWFLEL